LARFKAADGSVVTDEMIDGWCEALDRDEWPEGWKSRSEIVYGRPPLSVGGTVTLSIKVPVAMKQAIASEAKRRGTSTSNYARALLAEALLAE
jgi:hypothetical protein